MDPLSSSSNNLPVSYQGGAPKEGELVYLEEDQNKKAVYLTFLGELVFASGQDPFKLSEDVFTEAVEEVVANGSVDSARAKQHEIDIYDGGAICNFMLENYPDYFEMYEVFEIATKLLDIEEKLFKEFQSQLEGELSFAANEVMRAAAVEQTFNISEGFWQMWEVITGRDSPEPASISFVVSCRKKGPGKLELQLSVTDPNEGLSNEGEYSLETLLSIISRIKRTKDNAKFLDLTESQIAAEIEKEQQVDQRDIDDLVTIVNAQEKTPLNARQRKRQQQKAAKKVAMKWERLVVKMSKRQQKTACVTRRWALLSLKLTRLEAQKNAGLVKCFRSWGRRLQVKEFTLAYLNRAATSLQSVARGYLIRRETGKVLEVMRKLRGALKALEEKTKEFVQNGASDLSLVKNIRSLSEEVLKLSEETLIVKGDNLDAVTHKEER